MEDSIWNMIEQMDFNKECRVSSFYWMILIVKSVKKNQLSSLLTLTVCYLIYHYLFIDCDCSSSFFLPVVYVQFIRYIQQTFFMILIHNFSKQMLACLILIIIYFKLLNVRIFLLLAVRLIFFFKQLFPLTFQQISGWCHRMFIVRTKSSYLISFCIISNAIWQDKNKDIMMINYNVLEFNKK